MKRLAGVSTEVDLGECISHLPLQKTNFKINLLPDEVLCYFHWALESHEQSLPDQAASSCFTVFC